MTTTQTNEISTLSDAELDAVSGGSFNFNFASATQVNAVGFGGGVNQSNQAVNIQANQSDVCVSVSLVNCQT
jgi:hypothetical protein